MTRDGSSRKGHASVSCRAFGPLTPSVSLTGRGTGGEQRDVAPDDDRDVPGDLGGVQAHGGADAMTVLAAVGGFVAGVIVTFVMSALYVGAMADRRGK